MLCSRAGHGLTRFSHTPSARPLHPPLVRAPDGEQGFFGDEYAQAVVPSRAQGVIPG